MRPIRVTCQVFETALESPSRLPMIDATIRELDPESDAGIARLLVRLRAIIAQREDARRAALEEAFGLADKLDVPEIDAARDSTRTRNSLVNELDFDSVEADDYMDRHGSERFSPFRRSLAACQNQPATMNAERRWRWDPRH
ncbi:MAG: hypothetical protein R3C99_13805 [Pirellulaceae bacterium]|nr:hypothetical protein [Planctomycetales bacterium]